MCVCVCFAVGLCVWCVCLCVIYVCLYISLLACCVRVQKIGKDAVMSTGDSFVSVPFVDSTVFAAHFGFVPSAHLVISSAA